MSAPGLQLSRPQKQVVAHRGSDLQVIACAGSGKTESISRRIVSILEEGVPPAGIGAFTFTEKAAAELKERVVRRVGESPALGPAFRDRLGPMFVGTIHGYSFRILLDHVPSFGNHDILDEHRHAGFLARHCYALELGSLAHKVTEALDRFARGADVVANELIDPEDLDGTDFGACYAKYLELLTRHRFLTYGLLISEAVARLESDPAVFERVHGPLRHLLVDEYQDINPAQERLIELLSKKPVELCVVGDDDQSIYQWRGADVSNMVGFTRRRRRAASVTLAENRRSRPEIVRAAARFAKSIFGRLEKQMKPLREAGRAEIVAFRAATDEEEVARVADTIERLHAKGFRYRDLAVLFRSVRTSAPPLVAELEARGIPVSCGGRTGLFLQRDVALLGETFCWLADGDWKEASYGSKRKADLDGLVDGLSAAFASAGTIRGLRRYLEDWKSYLSRLQEPINLVGDFYKLLAFLHVERIDVDTPEGSARFGALARFSEVLADFEHVHRRGRKGDDADGRAFRGAQDRGRPYLQALGRYLLYYAFDAYEEFEGEPAAGLDAVQILTIHQAKGLEWPVVFLPALVDSRFPSRRAGKSQKWAVPEAVFPPKKRARYEGSEAEERRLFYVALTRARDAAYLSYFERKTNAFKPSPFLLEVAGKSIPDTKRLPLPEVPPAAAAPEPPVLEVSFSDLALFHECGYRYRLASVFGFQQELATELGYGRAIHHVLRQVAEQARAKGKPPTAAQLERLVEEEFFLPFANRPAFDQMKRAARRIVQRYVDEHADDLQRIWATERPFALHVDGGIISGRADVILDEEGGEQGALAVVDYKAANDQRRYELFELQLQVYAAAGTGEGLDIRGAYLHELRAAKRSVVRVGDSDLETAKSRAVQLLASVRGGKFTPSPSPDGCGACGWALTCRHDVGRPRA